MRKRGRKGDSEVRGVITDEPCAASQKLISVFFSVLWDSEGDFKELLNTAEIQDGSK